MSVGSLGAPLTPRTLPSYHRYVGTRRTLISWLQRNVSPPCIVVPLTTDSYPDLRRYTQAAGLRARFFNDKFVNLSRYLVDALVGNVVQSTPLRLPLTAGCWGIVYGNERIFLGEGAYVERDHEV